ncbi:MAG TPA: T9SS type A sorting domain-containing protein [Patescibacteria group bacterium]|nr:T9SS type A sorting domain-containing protein [Patescibacteria group bacterium]
MKPIYIFFKNFLPALLFVLAIALPHEALSQQTQNKTSEKSFSKGVRNALTTLRSKNVYTNQTATTMRSIADTTNKIKHVGRNPVTGSYSVIVELAQDTPQMQINVYNILGRKVVDVWRGDATKGEVITKDFTQEMQGLPEGMYICIVQGKDFRLAEKFTVSR